VMGSVRTGGASDDVDSSTELRAQFEGAREATGILSRTRFVGEVHVPASRAFLCVIIL
jgi:hypothetical protein